MRNLGKNITFLFLINLLMVGAYAQPCLTGWQYRKTIEVENTGTTSLTNHQVSIKINTQVLVALGKIRVDGGDIRFTNESGNNLSYWYDPAEFNTPNTTFWIRASDVPAASTSNIYMFYGNATSPAVASGEGTFEFFDSFDSGSISPFEWQKCGNNFNVQVVGGTATFQSNNSSSTKDYLLTSNRTFSSPVIAETKVNSANGGLALVGIVDALSQGYATVYDQSIVKMMKISSATSGDKCRKLDDLLTSSVAPTAVGSISGIMGFSWTDASKQEITWGGATQPVVYSNSDYQTFFGTPKQLIIGTSYDNIASGSMTVDYVRVRKYSANQPVLTEGTEDEAPVDAVANNTGAYCEGDFIVLSTKAYAGADYSWKGPGFSIPNTNQNPAPFPASLLNAGTYEVTITMPGTCNTTKVSTDVVVASASVSGTISGAATLCEGFNSGTLNLSGENGDILRWEMSNSSGGPWLTLSNTTNSLAYQNLSDTTYYRSVVKSGTCPEAISSSLQVNIDKETVGGFTIGTDQACDGLNGGDINLVYQNGDILKWESSTDGINWNDEVNNSSILTYSNLTNTTTYRAQVKSGICPAEYSSETTITVNPNPVADFSATTVCEGNNTVYTNNSNVATGSIVSYNWNFGNGSGSIAENPVSQFDSYGSNNVSLTAVSDKGCSHTVTKNVEVNANPSVDFNFANVCFGFPMIFQSVVSVPGSTIANLNWDLGDGNSSSQVNVNHSYAASGNYNVNLIATSAQGCVDSLMQEVIIAQPVTVDFVADSVCLGESIEFVNTSVSGSSNVQYTWNFGDGGTSVLNSPTYTYSAQGVYSVILQASLSGNNTSCQSSKTLNVEIYERPSANFAFNNECLEDTVNFVNQTIYSGGLGNLNYNWNLNDGNFETTQDVNHRYLIPGLYNVSLEVETMFGCTSEIDKQVEIFEMPTLGFTAEDVCLGELTEFTNSSFISVGSLTFEWDFDNNTTSTDEEPNLNYSSDGTYDVELIATSNNGCMDTLVSQYTIYPHPNANFTAPEVCDGFATNFVNTSTVNTGSITSYGWDFSDGSSSTGVSPTHQFLNVDNYNVNLAIVSDQGCTDDTTIVVVVNPNPVANFEVLDACDGTAVEFTNNSFIAFGTMSDLWDFGDGASSNLSSPSNLFLTPGLFDVKLIVTSGKGCMDSIIKPAEVFSPPVFSVGADDSISLGDEIELEGFYSGAIAYSWSPSEGLDNNSLSNPIASPTEETVYTLTMTDGNGCVGSDSIMISVIDDFILQVNNVITPDGNGINDSWVIGNIENYGQATVYIYDRWGQEVLKTTEYNNDWNGVSGTDQLPDGTYYYVITVPNQEKVYKGGLTVLRNQ